MTVNQLGADDERAYRCLVSHLDNPMFVLTASTEKGPGDHLGLVLAPVAAECRDHGPQLGFQAVRDFHPGHPA